jgi:hypothetical protein
MKNENSEGGALSASEGIADDNRTASITEFGIDAKWIAGRETAAGTCFDNKVELATCVARLEHSSECDCSGRVAEQRDIFSPESPFLLAASDGEWYISASKRLEISRIPVSSRPSNCPKVPRCHVRFSFSFF